MLKYLDRLYCWFPQTNSVWRSLRYGVRVLANVYVRWLMPISNKQSEVNADTIIVSFTSYPARIKNVWMTVATLLAQSYQNMYVVLWLSKDQFPEGTRGLPKKLQRLRKKGLDIRFVDDDLRPHKKYFYATQEFPNNNIVTVDDDILYHPSLVSYLVSYHRKYPNCVVCNRGVLIKRTAYRTWPLNTFYCEERRDVMPTGIGGVLYPAHIFDETPIFDSDTIRKTCLNGDDLWLNLMTRLAGRKVVQTAFKTGLITILSSQSSALCQSNVNENYNDLQIKTLNSWVRKVLNVDFMINVK